MFKHIKTFIFFIIAVVGVLGAVYWAGETGKLAHTPFKNLNHKKLNIFSDEDVKQAQVLSSRVQESKQHVQKVLGENIEAEEEQGSLQGRTLEYARYLYCKQVVEDWEIKQNQK